MSADNLLIDNHLSKARYRVPLKQGLRRLVLLLLLLILGYRVPLKQGLRRCYNVCSF